MKKMFNEGNQIHNFMSSSGSGTVINYGSSSGFDFLTSYGSGYGSGSTNQKVTVPTVPVPVPQHCLSGTSLDSCAVGLSESVQGCAHEIFRCDVRAAAPEGHGVVHVAP